MSAIRPNRDQFMELLQSTDEGPVVMVNLLKYKGGGGSKEYGKYGSSVKEMIEAQGGTVLWIGRAEQVLIGDPAEDWDAVVLVQYPSRKAFIEMVSTKEYDSIHEDREAGLERTMLIACTPRADGTL